MPLHQPRLACYDHESTESFPATWLVIGGVPFPLPPRDRSDSGRVRRILHMAVSKLLLLLTLCCRSLCLVPKAKDGSSKIDTVSPDALKAGRKYLISSFPALKQVGYTILPDTVWRPLVLGEVQSPTSIAVDPLSSRLYVADPPRGVIWWYQLGTGSNGLLQTVGRQRAAVEGFSAHWLAVNGAGDLYFSGHPLPKAGENSTVDSVWRLDNEQVVTGDSFNPAEVYTTQNTGQPDSKVFQLSGLAVDSFFIFWGNQAGGKEHGAVNKGTRANIGMSSQDMFVSTLTDSVDEVRGITTSGTEVFWLSPEGVYGQSKTTTSKVSDPSAGLISPAISLQWNPMSIAWDGATQLYLTDASAGAIYTVPSLISTTQNLTKFADAPDCHGLAILLSARGLPLNCSRLQVGKSSSHSHRLLRRTMYQTVMRDND
ncbi:unnamed protein product [Symbiodinium necroappetens]|uniref:Uncharacterized protein n=1 Tax=Symbiodinium necroappetens TaxID=1628268 RepID=A0A812V7J5_9DINO|nr:unnamed protein product [Symbiodinium necroappetens]